jgi:hypothetical protein
MAVTIQTRRDDSTDWSTANPVLALGEIGIETNTDKAKYGDGFTAWNDLPYWIDEGAQIPDGTAQGQTLRYNLTNDGWEANSDLIVADTGNVGIGLTAADTLLELAAQNLTAFEGGIKLGEGTVAGDAYIGFTQASPNDHIWYNSPWVGFTGNPDLSLAVLTLNSPGVVAFTGTNATERMRIDSGGKLLIGASLVYGNEPPNGKLFVGGEPEQIQIGGGFIQRTGSCGLAFSGAVVLPASEGAVTVSATDLGRTANRWRAIYLANQPDVSSDAATKTVIGDAKGLDFISALRPVEFTRIAEEAQTKYMGFVAQEVKALTGDGYGVVSGEEGSMGMAYAELIAPLVKAIQELTARIEALENS